MTVRKIKPSLLVLDYTLYPRQHLDTDNLSRLKDAIDAGVALPPIVADKDTLKVVDGFHRTTLATRSDPDAAVAVEVVDYADERAMFLDAVARNVGHGARLSSIDRARCLNLAVELHIEPEQIASALSITPDRADKIVSRRRAFDAHGKPLELKRLAKHLAGKKLTESQRTANTRAAGMPVSFFAGQIINAIDGNLIDWSDGHTSERLRVLRDRLVARLQEQDVDA